LEFLNSQPYYASKKKLLSSRQIFRYAVPARTVTKKALNGGRYVELNYFSQKQTTPERIRNFRIHFFHHHYYY